MYMEDLRKGSQKEMSADVCRRVRRVPKADPEWQDYLDHS